MNNINRFSSRPQTDLFISLLRGEDNRRKKEYYQIMSSFPVVKQNKAKQNKKSHLISVTNIQFM